MLISAGRSNRYDHPHDEVIDRLEQRGVLIWRSDRDGAIQLSIENGKVKVKRAMK
ncbi:hypothetical protein [Bacillus sp. JCM 19034]|uniref:hypothetical protein n=1 Tax=Bacillus sp. JCM 19034 TaxID=1481928 RepID=UPI000B064A4D|nr:hypothetical protein [Bacillus sp. JCM 19034]